MHAVEKEVKLNARLCIATDHQVSLISNVMYFLLAAHVSLGPICLGCGWLCRESCCAGKAAVRRKLLFRVLPFGNLAGCLGVYQKISEIPSDISVPNSSSDIAFVQNSKMHIHATVPNVLMGNGYILITSSATFLIS
jgi:hypothetical protein